MIFTKNIESLHPYKKAIIHVFSSQNVPLGEPPFRKIDSTPQKINTHNNIELSHCDLSTDTQTDYKSLLRNNRNVGF